ncbi:MAG TPA: DNA primase [Opitutae bacterium]|nr:DNA primase [Opitutae bacterium]
MPRLADGFVSELKDRIDLYDLISRYVQLKKSGSSWVGLSPFNQEKTPSFYVHPQKGFFNCFSSGEKGDGITFIQKMENLEFYEAIEYLSREFNIPLRFQEGSSHHQSGSQSLRKGLFEIHEVTKNWFREQFKKNETDNRKALEYWIKERGFSEDDAAEFGVGFAPVDRFVLGNYLSRKGFPEVLLEKSGLFYSRKGNKNWVSIFCGRLMIPIREKLGRICGFTGRKLLVTPEWGDKKAPKYINSPETPIFSKGQLLFNFHLANKEINEQKDFILVEGQLDAIRCYLKGFKTAVAPQGTAFKQSQAELLRKANPRRVVCLLDGDEAGQKAAMSYVPIFLQTGLDAHFATLPEGSDPDQILVKQGKDALSEIIQQGQPAINYVCSKMLGKTPTPLEKRRASDFFFPSLADMESLVMRDSYLNELSRVLEISPQSVKTDFQKFIKTRRPAYQQKSATTSTEKISVSGTERLTTAEDDLLYCLLHDVRLGNSLAQVIEPSWLDTKVIAGHILAKLLAEITADGPLNVPEMEELLEDDQERFLFQNLLYQNSDDETDLVDLANQCISAFVKRSSRKTEKKLLHAMQDESSNSSELRIKLKEIRSSQTNPPQILETELESSY